MKPVDAEPTDQTEDVIVGVAVGAGAPGLTAFLLPEGGPLAIVLMLGCLLGGMYLTERSENYRGIGKGLIWGAGGLLLVGGIGFILLGAALGG